MLAISIGDKIELTASVVPSAPTNPRSHDGHMERNELITYFSKSFTSSISINENMTAIIVSDKSVILQAWFCDVINLCLLTENTMAVTYFK